MLTIQWPWLFTLLPLPLLVYYTFPAVSSLHDVISFPFLSQARQLTADSHVTGFRIKPVTIIAIMMWIFLVAAIAKPVWVGDPVSLPTKGRNLMLAVDISPSMQEKDIQMGGEGVTRLSIVKSVVSDFVKRRDGDRLGLVVFGTQAFLHVPLTFDRKTITQQLNDVDIGMAGSKTAIGDAIGLSIKRLQNQLSDQRVLILLTDGANTTGQVDPIQSAKLAKQESVKIYTIGIGADIAAVDTFFGQRFINPSADLDEETLTEIAKLTQGKYFRAKTLNELRAVYDELDTLEAIAADTEVMRPKKELYFIPLAIALCLSMVIAILRFGKI